MKVLAEEVKCGFTERGAGVMKLFGLNYSLTMFIPSITVMKIIEKRDPRQRTDQRKSITDLFEDKIRKLDTRELYIDSVSDRGTYTAVLTLGENPIKMVPSEGILLCSIIDKPIYFESELLGVEKTEKKDSS
jgi:bifunctional DNase/RNase